MTDIYSDPDIPHGFMEDVRGIFRDELRNFLGADRPVDDTDMSVDDMHSSLVGAPMVPIISPGDDPVAVRIVSAEPAIVVQRPSRSFTSSKTIVNTVPQRAAGYDPQRRLVTLVNQSPNRIAFAGVENAQYGGAGKFGSGELMPLTALTLYTIADIWVVGGNASGDDLTVIQEFEYGR